MSNTPMRDQMEAAQDAALAARVAKRDELAAARETVAAQYAVERATGQDRRRGWRWVVYIPGTAQRMTDGDLATFARNLRYYG